MAREKWASSQVAMLSNRPVFVIGHMHSGTTLILNILKNNSCVFSSEGETKFFDFGIMIHRSYPSLDNDEVLREFVGFVVNIITRGFSFGRAKRTAITGDAAGIVNEGLMTCAKTHREHGKIFRLVFDALTYRSGKSRWVEKTPSHVFHIDEIVRAVPDALFVEIVRDPRDVLASKKTRQETVGERYEPEERPEKFYEKSYDPFWDTLSWKSAIRAGMHGKSLFSHRILTIQYETLVSFPLTTIQTVCQFLGMKFEPAMLDVSAGISADWRESRAGGIRSDSVGRWRSVLRPEEIELCQWLVRSEMLIHGYTSTHGSLSLVKMLILLWNSIIEFLVRLYSRWRFGGILYLSNVLFNYFWRLYKLVARW